MSRRPIHLLVLVFFICSIALLRGAQAQVGQETLHPNSQLAELPDFSLASATSPGTVIELRPTAAPAPFTFMMLRWQAPDELVFEARASEDGHVWTDWGAVHENGDLHAADDPPDLHWSGALYTGLANFWQLRFTAAPDHGGSVAGLSQVQVDTVDARGSDTLTTAQIAPAQTGERIPFISRAAWGGDVVLSRSDPPRWHRANHLVVHHTADSNSLRAHEGSWADRVRAIWSFHTYSRGWGDIGYNWLVDPNGVIYEGRNGSSVTENDSVGSHDTANYGSMGVALLGTFGPGAAAPPIVPRAAAQRSLVALFAWKAAQRGIDPLGSSRYEGCARSRFCAPHYPGAIVPNIAGHRDITPGHTSCPGDYEAGLLDATRQAVRDAMGTSFQPGPPPPTPTATTPPDTTAPDTTPTRTPARRSPLEPTATLTPSATPLPTGTPTPIPTATPVPPTATPKPFTRIEGDAHWTADQSPIIVQGDQVIAAGTTLRVDPGVEVWLKPGVDIYVDGELILVGTAEAPVRLAGPEGRWGAIIGRAGGGITMEHAELRQAGSQGAAIRSSLGRLILKHVLVTDGGGGVAVESSTFEMWSSQITGNDLQGGPALNVGMSRAIPVTVRGNILGGNLRPLGGAQLIFSAGQSGNGPLDILDNIITGTDGPLLEIRTVSPIDATIRCNGFDGGSVGLQFNASTASAEGFGIVVDNNAFEKQTTYGIASTISLGAGNNWWGDASGPADAQRNPQGLGMRVGVNVDFAPALAARPTCALSP